MTLTTNNVVVIGASYAGSSVAHIFLKHIHPELPKTGAEYHLAGKIGEYLNGAAGWFSQRPSKPQAKVTLIAGADKLLPTLGQKLSDWAVSPLKQVGVDVIYSLCTTSTEQAADGTTLVYLDDDMTIECDLFIPAIGVRPNTAFVPKNLLNKKGYIKTNTSTLQVDEAGPCVYCVGDVESYTRGGLIDLIEAVLAAMTNLKRDLLAAHDIL
ncbi:hypothetical protein E4T43_06444 [Aureobasidium subglaciale]|nr:hypothetical protein E4T43_06444 [Aureobasidium subglaciale]